MATFNFKPGAGVHSYKAVFAGNTAFPGGMSSAAALTVTHTASATATTLAVTGSAGNYTLTGTTTGAGAQFAAPGGSMSFVDTTASSTIGTAALVAGTTKVTLTQQPSFAVSTCCGGFGAVASGDLNGDGYPDIEVPLSSGVAILKNNGDGTFTQVATVGASYGTTFGATLADVNGDGKLDLIQATYTSGLIVYLGNGDEPLRTRAPPTA